jgi:hypothetical protein
VWNIPLEQQNSLPTVYTSLRGLAQCNVESFKGNNDWDLYTSVSYTETRAKENSDNDKQDTATNNPILNNCNRGTIIIKYNMA